MTDLDLLIIGTGSGNSILNHEFEGMRVGMIERDVWGGTCLNRGCIPSKMLVLPAERIIEADEAARLGVELRFVGADWPAIRDRVFGRIDPIADSGRKYRIGQDFVEVFEGDARFTGPRTVTVDGTEITAERIVLAAGARPRHPGRAGPHRHPVPHLGHDHADRRGPRTPRHPRRWVHRRGARQRVPGARQPRERDPSRRPDAPSRRPRDLRAVHRGVRPSGLHLHRSSGLRSVSHDGTEFTVELDCPQHCHSGPGADPAVVRDGDRELLRADVLLVATGRIPNGEQLGVGAAGVALDDDGYVVTDPTLRTTAEGIWALGDIANPLQLKHLANRDARVVQHNLLHPDDPRSVDDRVVPRAVFSHPQVGSVGRREDDLVEDGERYVVGRCDYGGTAYGWALEDTSSFAKVLVDPDTLQLLGGHVIGPQAATLTQQLTQAMTFEVPVDQLARRQIWLHPGLAEVLENALLDALDQRLTVRTLRSRTCGLRPGGPCRHASRPVVGPHRSTIRDTSTVTPPIVSVVSVNVTTCPVSRASSSHHSSSETCCTPPQFTIVAGTDAAPTRPGNVATMSSRSIGLNRLGRSASTGIGIPASIMARWRAGQPRGVPSGPTP